MDKFPPLRALKSVHIKDARLYADRFDALVEWPAGATVAEIGVAYGKFSSEIISRTNPKLFDAYDTFILHTKDALWGRHPSFYFGDKTHIDFYREKYSALVMEGKLRTFCGDSSSNIRERDNGFYDVIYIDGDHSKNGVLKDISASIPALSQSGMLVFNDYVVYDKAGHQFGVVPIVNELCINHGWKVKYFALNMEMFCDIGIVRA